MKTSNFIIRIPEPCHEDWNTMQPDAKGKFCNLCSKSVFDFSNKTDIEIRDILIEYKDQKVCGHFKKTQIDRPLNIKINLNDLPRNISATKVFVIAIFLVFGTILFSCTNDKNQKIETIEVVNTTLQKEFIKATVTQSLEMITGDMAVQTGTLNTVCETMHLAGAINIDEGPYIEEELMTGEVATVIEDSVKGKTKLVNLEPKDTTIFIAADTSIKQISRSINKEVFSKSSGFIVYPNPNTGEFTIRYAILKKSGVRVDIIDLHGILVKTIVNMADQYEGKYQIPVNLNELPNGIYFVTIIINGKRNTEKIIIER